jgi:hypothetical protein
MPISLEDLTTDQLLARARELEGSANLISSLSTNPETRTQLQRLIKTINPSLVIPELDSAIAVEAQLKTRDDKIAELENKFLEKEVKDRLEKQRKDVQTKYKLADADMLEVEKMMVDPDPNQRIPGYEAAARVFSASKQTAIPTHSNAAPPTFSMPEQDVWGKGIGNKAQLDKIALNEAYSAWNEALGGKVA